MNNPYLNRIEEEAQERIKHYMDEKELKDKLNKLMQRFKEDVREISPNTERLWMYCHLKTGYDSLELCRQGGVKHE